MTSTITIKTKTCIVFNSLVNILGIKNNRIHYKVGKFDRFVRFNRFINDRRLMPFIEGDKVDIECKECEDFKPRHKFEMCRFCLGHRVQSKTIKSTRLEQAKAIMTSENIRTIAEVLTKKTWNDFILIGELE